MIAAWMLYAVAIGTLIALAALGTESLLRTLGKPTRWVWCGAMALTLGMSVAALFRANTPVALLPQLTLSLPNATLAKAPEVSALMEFMQSVDHITSSIVGALTFPAERALASVARSLGSANAAAAAFSMALAGLALVWLGTVYARYARARRAWPTVMLQGVLVRVTPDVGPAVIGIAPPEIVVPHWVLARHAAEQRLVIAHESEHVSARDPLMLLVSSVVVALMPWHAAMWFMWSRLRLAVEIDCDRRVLQRGAHKPAYGNLLVELSGHRSSLSPVMPAFAFGTSHLEQRIVAMTARPSQYRWFRRIGSASVVTVALVAACTTELPTAADVAKMDAKSATARMLPADGDVEYRVDGVASSKAAADAIASEQISSVAVVRGTKSSPHSVIDIKLKRDSLRSVATVGKSARSADSVVLVADTLVLRAQGAEILAVNPAGVQARVMADSAIKVAGAGTGTRIRIRGHATNEPLTIVDGFLRTPLVGQPTANAAAEPLVLVDGVVRNGDGSGKSGLDGLKPESIASIEVFKGPSAATMSTDPRAKNGIIKITLKH